MKILNKELEVSFAITEEEKERIKKILLGAGGLRHYLLRLTDGTELDVVNYDEYKKLEEMISKLKTNFKFLEDYIENNKLVLNNPTILQFYMIQKEILTEVNNECV